MAPRLIIRWGTPQAGNRAGKTINSLQCWDQIAERGPWTARSGTATTRGEEFSSSEAVTLITTLYHRPARRHTSTHVHGWCDLATEGR